MISSFWIMTIGTLSIVFAVMGYLGWLACKVPDGEDKKSPRRLKGDQIRLLAYAVVVVLLLLGGVYELLMYAGIEKERAAQDAGTATQAPQAK
ncbi:hypothetical protein IT570_08295 [Candidatus Sumerlaeota bacterium]|nr:hypothetical protein [Candidatus Sumerlaeota bacterium]